MHYIRSSTATWVLPPTSSASPSLLSLRNPPALFGGGGGRSFLLSDVAISSFVSCHCACPRCSSGGIPPHYSAGEERSPRRSTCPVALRPGSPPLSLVIAPAPVALRGNPPALFGGGGKPFFPPLKTVLWFLGEVGGGRLFYPYSAMKPSSGLSLTGTCSVALRPGSRPSSVVIAPSYLVISMMAAKGIKSRRHGRSIVIRSGKTVSQL